VADHATSIDYKEGIWNVYSRQMNSCYTAQCTCGWTGIVRWDRYTADQDALIHIDEMAKIDPDMTIYDVLLELIDAHAWGSEAIKQRRVQAIQAARDNKVFGIEGNYKL
jgi:hypothetical protein